LSTTKEIKIPDIGTDEKVEVIEILVKTGDKIAAEDPIVTLESEKASMDVPSSDPGVVKDIKIKLGDKVGRGDVVLTLETKEATKTEKKEEKTKKTEEKSQATKQSETEKKQSSADKTQTIYIPDLGTDAAVDVIEVLVNAGDKIERDDPIATLEGDKASMDVPASSAGKIKKLHIKTGDKVKSDDKLADLEVSSEQATQETTKKAQEKPAEKASAKEEKTEEKPAEEREQSESTDDLYAGPAVRRLARELDVDLTRITGTGRKGRIQLEDLHKYVKSAMREGQGGGLSLPEAPRVDHSKFGEIEEKPLSKIQKISGPNLQRNWIVVPHVTQFDEADITDLEDFRKSQNKIYKAKDIKITPLAFIMKAAVAALKAFPHFNASLAPEGDKLILKKYFHIGVAVDTPNGLVVAVIRDVDKKGIVDISQELATISEKARTKGLSLNEMQGSSFTISSLGGIGGTAFTPIVNMPDVAILGVSRSQIKPIYQEGEFVPRLMLPLSLSYDHRVIDGADGARFTKKLVETLSDIRSLVM